MYSKNNQGLDALIASLLENGETQYEQQLAKLRRAKLTMPSADVLDRVLSVYQRRAKRAQVRPTKNAALQFDSLIAGAVGVRGGSLDERQLMFSSDTVHIDMQIVTADKTVHGQVLMSADTADGLTGLELHLIHQENDADTRIGLTDRFGRFTFTHILPGNYTLQLLGEESDVVIEPITVAA